MIAHQTGRRQAPPSPCLAAEALHNPARVARPRGPMVAVRTASGLARVSEPAIARLLEAGMVRSDRIRGELFVDLDDIRRVTQRGAGHQ